MVRTLVEKLFGPMPLNDFSDYDDYWEKRTYMSSAIRRARIIAKYISKQSVILDIGCGDGTLIKYLTKEVSPQCVMGIDVSQAAVERLNAEGYSTAVIDITSPIFAEYLQKTNFDTIVILEVLEHIPNPETVIRDILLSGFRGQMFISIPNAGFIIHRLRLLFGRFPVVMVQLHVKEHLRYWTVKDFKYWADKNGLAIESAESTKLSDNKLLLLLEKISLSLFAWQIMYKVTVKH